MKLNVNIANSRMWSEETDDWIVPGPNFGVAVIQQSPILRFVISYPLTRPKTVELTHDDGSAWTEWQFVEAVVQAYAAVYTEEGKHPGYVSGLLNRSESSGPHGIWGHDLGDLILEGASQNEDGSWQLSVGS